MSLETIVGAAVHVTTENRMVGHRHWRGYITFPDRRLPVWLCDRNSGQPCRDVDWTARRVEKVAPAPTPLPVAADAPDHEGHEWRNMGGRMRCVTCHRKANAEWARKARAAA